MKVAFLLGLGILSLGISGQAQAEYYAHCALVGGGERALIEAPKSFYLEEYGSTKLKTEVDLDGNPTKFSKVYSTDDGNLTSNDGWPTLEVKALDAMVQGIYTLDLKSCDQYEESQAVYTWINPYLDSVQNNGTAIYKCKCAVD